jgi:hypothetical protein
VNHIRAQPNWMDMENTSEALDQIALELAKEGGTSYSELEGPYDLTHI